MGSSCFWSSSSGRWGGGLRDEFEIPGSETQKATDLIESEFASEQGGVLNIVVAAPEGQRLDTPERRTAIERAIARLESREFAPTEDRAGLESIGATPSARTPSPTMAQFDRVIYDEDVGRSSPWRTPCARRWPRPA